MTEQFYRRIDDVVHREVAGEAFLVPIRGHVADLQELFVMNEVGHWLWSRLDGSSSLDDLVEGIVAEFDVDEDQARRDAESFVRQLADAGLAVECVGPVV